MKNLLLIKRFSNSDKKIPQSWIDLCKTNKLEFFKFSNISILSSHIYYLNNNTIIFSEYNQSFFSNKQNIFINISDINKFFKLNYS